jgi:hypothetical protein
VAEAGGQGGLTDAQFIDLGMRRCQRVLLGLRPHGQAFGVHELHVRHAQESQHRLQIWHLRVGWRVAVLPATGQGHIHLLAGEQPHGALVGVGEGDAGTGDRIDPVLELRRHAEVVHGHPQHQHIGRLDFGDQRVVNGHAGSLFGRALFGGCEQGLQGRFVQLGQRLAPQIAHGQRAGAICRSHALGDFAGQAAGVRSIRAGAGVDLQDVHDGSFGWK